MVKVSAMNPFVLLAEVKGIINSRPITCEFIGDVNSIIPLIPMQLLSSKTRVVMPPPGTFQKEDMCCRKQCWCVQHLSTKFWARWRKEVFATLQTRQKWNQTKQNFEVGDIVLVRDDFTTRNKWPMARILKTYSDEKGLVRSVQLVTGRTNSTNKETLIFDRPVNKLDFPVENELWKAMFKNIDQYLDGRSVTVRA